MGLDPRFVTSLELQSQFVDKETGEPLRGGFVYFFSDINRNNPKPVYELTGSPPNYTYTALPNPLQLTDAGTFSDGANNDISVYYFPFDGTQASSNGNIENYYIQVFAEPSVPPFPPLGTPEITREAVPGETTESGPGATGPSSTENELVNSQFATVFFNATNGLSVPYTAGTTTFEFAPGWTLEVVATGSGTVDLNRAPIAGNVNFATNPPYALMVNPTGAGITSLAIYQKLEHNPNIFASGYIVAGIALAPNSPRTQIFYAPQNAAVLPAVLDVSNASGQWHYYTNTVPYLLNPGTNPNTADAGYTNIRIQLSPTSLTTFSSVQILGNGDASVNIPYNQQPVIQQQNQTFFYFNDLLRYKQIPSFLVGWDFPLNPAQINGTTVSFFSGANSAQYFWDQTIVFQTATNSVSATRAANGQFRLACVQPGQVALIQYLDQAVAKQILRDRISINLDVSGDIAGGTLSGNVSLWATTDANLPTLPLSVIATLGADGIPATHTGTWTEVPNIYNNKSFTVSAANATNDESANIMLNGWDLAGAVPSNTATFFAIVIGFSAWAVSDSLSFDSISLCAGDIATRPAPKTQGETLLDCQRYFYSTFPLGTKPVTAFGQDTGCLSWSLVSITRGMHFNMNYPVPMRVDPNVIIYNPVSANNLIRDISGAPGDLAGSTAGNNVSEKHLDLTCPNGSLAGSTVADILQAHVTSDARLGVVN